MAIEKLILEDVRCFAGRNEFDIRPLTFLVGENSTGKSSVLGCFQAFSSFFYYPRPGMNFNEPPYQMGTFGSIVRKSNPKSERFAIGVCFDGDSNLESVESVLYNDTEAGLIVEQMKINFSTGSVVFQFAKGQHKNMSPLATFSAIRKAMVEHRRGERNKELFVVRVPFPGALLHAAYMERFLFGVMDESEKTAIDGNRKKLIKFLKKDDKLISYIDTVGKMEAMESVAPIQSLPQRVYHSQNLTKSPRGDDVPERLMKLKDAEWSRLKKRLNWFGEESGLFRDINVKKLGGASNAFEIQVKVRGPFVNLVDVGFGVSQVLPLLVNVLLGWQERRKEKFLLQQPEVHLHPQGQAVLSTLLIDAVKNAGHSFVIETHSDAMIDRARIEIMHGNINPKDVSLIYFEPKGNKVKGHNIRFDEQANLLGVPAKYRYFFLDEADKLLGFKK